MASNWGYYRTLANNGLQGALVESRPIYHGSLRPGQLYESLRPFHAIVFCNPEEGVPRMDAAAREQARTVRADLERYVSQGGGLLLLLQPVRYPHDEDELFENAVMEGFGVRMLHEGLFDTAHTFRAATLVFPAMEFFYTGNIRPHPTTEGVRRLYLPRYGSQPAPAIEALGLSADWQAVVSGEPRPRATCWAPTTVTTCSNPAARRRLRPSRRSALSAAAAFSCTACTTSTHS